jgi:hypothetical protein
MNDIVADPGLRKPIDEFPHEIRDDAKRAYLQIGPCQPFGHTFPRTPGNSQTRGFVESWFKQFDWLEYNVQCTEKLIEQSKIYDADFSDYERTCLMDQLLLFIDEVRNDGFRDCNDLGHLATKMVK